MKVLTKYFSLLAFICFLGLNLYAQENALTLQEFRKAVDNESNIDRKVKLLNDYSKKLRQTIPDEAIDFSSEALQLSQESGKNNLIILSLISQGEAYFYAENINDADQTLSRAVELAKSASLLDLELRASTVLGFIYIDSNPKKAYDFLAEAKNKAEDAGNQARLADVYAKLGDWFLVQNDGFEEALNKYAQAIEIYKELELLDDLAYQLNHVGETYLKRNDSNKALLSFMEAYNYGQSVNDKSIITSALNRIGFIYSDAKKDYTSALKYYRECYRISKNYNFINNGQSLATALRGTMQCYEYLAKYNAQNNNRFKADEYDKIYRTYQEIYFQLRQSDFSVASIRDGQSNNNQNDANSNNSRVYTNPSPLDDEGNIIDNNDGSLLEEQTVAEDRGKIIEELSASGELDKDTLNLFEKTQNNDTPKITNNNSVNAEQSTPKNNYLWLAVILILMTLTTTYALIKLHNSEKLIVAQKKKLHAYSERINRQEVVLREQENNSNKKEVELAESYNKLDDALLEKSALTQILDEEVKPPLKKILEKSKDEKINPLVIGQSAKYALNLISSIIDVQNLEKDHITLHKDNYSVYKVARSALNQFSEVIKEKGITIQNHIKPFYYAEFDEEIIERVFLCLLENAIKYTSPEGLITLDAWQASKDQRQFISVSLMDNGQRIPTNALPFVFNKYSPEEARPSGLGMAYVKMAVEAHQGTVDVISTPEEGTRFVFVLPESKVSPNTNQGANTNKISGFNYVEVLPSLNDTEKELLKPFVDQISGQKIYETSLLFSKLSQIQSTDHENIELWVKQLKEAIFSLNEDKFNKLLALV